AKGVIGPTIGHFKRPGPVYRVFFGSRQATVRASRLGTARLFSGRNRTRRDGTRKQRLDPKKPGAKKSNVVAATKTRTSASTPAAAADPQPAPSHSNATSERPLAKRRGFARESRRAGRAPPRRPSPRARAGERRAPSAIARRPATPRAP